MDTGRWESSCNLSHPAHPHGAHGAAARHVFNCSAWAAGYDKPGWTRPPLGTFEDFFHLVLPNLEFSLRANAMIAQPPAGSGINCRCVLLYARVPRCFCARLCFCCAAC